MSRELLGQTTSDSPDRIVKLGYYRTFGIPKMWELPQEDLHTGSA
jgi:hypothetical protein